MPFKIVKDSSGRCSESKPWAVVSEGSGNTLGCHETKEKAERQLRAVKETYKSDDSFMYAVSLDDVDFVEEHKSWVHTMPMNVVYKHPQHGDLDFSVSRLQRFADNIRNKVRGTDLDIDYDHKKKDGRAAGWVQDATVRGDGLWVLVEWTKAAAEAIKNKEYRYISPEFVRAWEHPETGEIHENIMLGGALTNRPFLKSLNPINLSELEKQEEGMDPKLRAALIKRLGLSEDVSDEDLIAKLNEDPEEAPKPDLSSAEVKVGDDGTITVTHPEADGEVTYKPEQPKSEPKDKELAKLAEDIPAVKKLMERVSTLEASDRLSQASIRLSELNGINKQVALPPVASEKFKEILAKAPVALSDEVYEALTEIVKTGLVQLGEEGGMNPGSEGESGTKKFMDRVEAYQKENKVSFSDATSVIAATEPDLYQAYLSDLEEAAK